jgi:hypothetical protein
LPLNLAVLTGVRWNLIALIYNSFITREVEFISHLYLRLCKE